MKKLILLIVLLFPFVLQAQNYFKEGTTWFLESRNIDPTNPRVGHYSITFETDEVQKWSALYETNDDTGKKDFLVYVKVDGDKVFFNPWEWDTDDWFLLYDFGLNVGEGCYVYDAYSAITKREYDRDDRNVQSVYVKCVEIVDKHEWAVSPPLMVFDQYKDETCEEINYSDYFKLHWVKGIGMLSPYGVILNQLSSLAGVSISVKRVVDKDGKVVLDVASSGINETETVKSPRVEVDGLEIKVFSNDDFCDVYSADGKHVGSFRLIDGVGRISLCANGVYILKVGGDSYKIMI